MWNWVETIPTDPYHPPGARYTPETEGYADQYQFNQDSIVYRAIYKKKEIRWYSALGKYSVVPAPFFGNTGKPNILIRWFTNLNNPNDYYETEWGMVKFSCNDTIAVRRQYLHEAVRKFGRVVNRSLSEYFSDLDGTWE